MGKGVVRGEKLNNKNNENKTQDRDIRNITKQFFSDPNKYSLSSVGWGSLEQICFFLSGRFKM